MQDRHSSLRTDPVFQRTGRQEKGDRRSAGNCMSAEVWLLS